ncbi:MAG: glycosyltransferase [Muribaculaceae bacterium]|nr:glycosyltransferase [Muribaculaceae bacterium]
MKPKISVVVPVYNVEKYLGRCVQSLQNQTLHEIEIILVDDGSPDNSPALCDEYAGADSRVKVVHKKNGGLGMACNSGIEVATGEYIAFCDSDDWVDESMYGVMCDMAAKYGADMVFTGIRQVDQNGIETPMSEADELKVYTARKEVEMFAMDMIASSPSVGVERRVPMSAKIVLYRRAFLVENNIRFESEREFITEDLLFNLDCLSCAKTVVEVPQTFYNYFINTASLSRVIRKDRFEKIKTVFFQLLSRYKFECPEFKTRCYRLLSGYTRVALCQICVSDLPLSDKRTLIKQICNDSVWPDFRRDYPVKEMVLSHRLFQFLILNRLYLPILLIGRFKR